MEKPKLNCNTKPYQQYQIVYRYYKQVLSAKIAVLLECGSMYHFYGIDQDDRTPEDLRNNFSEIIHLLGLRIENKPNPVGSPDHPHIAGFPAKDDSHYIRKLENSGYVIIFIVQVEDKESNPRLPKQRVVGDIITPGISQHFNDKLSSSSVVSLYIENKN